MAAVEVSWGPAAEVAPLKDGIPDLYNFMPSRNVTKDEAVQRGWKHFYVGSRCTRGHCAPRYVTNDDQCVDCVRAKKGKELIGATVSGATPKRGVYRTETIATSTGAVTKIAPVVIEPDRLEKKFLEQYADTKDFDNAAIRSGASASVFQARMAYSKVFKDAVLELETRLGLKPTPPINLEPFAWNDDLRRLFFRVYIDTGMVDVARNAIRVSPFEFFKELETNAEFKAEYDRVSPLAARVLDDKAVQLAVSGNDKVLMRTLTAKIPEEYGERVKVDLSVERLTDDQLRARILSHLGPKRPRIIEGEATVIESEPTALPVRDAGSDETPAGAPRASDLL